MPSFTLPQLPAQYQMIAWIALYASLFLVLAPKVMRALASRFQTCPACRKVAPARATRCPSCGQALTGKGA